MSSKKYIFVLLALILLAAAGYFGIKSFTKNNQPADIKNIKNASQDAPGGPGNLSESGIQKETQAEPSADFKARITKKPFGIYITPENSPVELEKFTGYHTGVDVEYEDITDDVPVYAVNEGQVVFSGTISGYGGVLVINQNINGVNILCIYGHLDPSNMKEDGVFVSKGEQIAVLGDAYSAETGSERKHLHFGMIKNGKIDFRGYVQNESELSGWYNPLDYFK